MLMSLCTVRQRAGSRGAAAAVGLLLEHKRIIWWEWVCSTVTSSPRMRVRVFTRSLLQRDRTSAEPGVWPAAAFSWQLYREGSLMEVSNHKNILEFEPSLSVQIHTLGPTI